jgi:hypothetical protein
MLSAHSSVEFHNSQRSVMSETLSISNVRAENTSSKHEANAASREVPTNDEMSQSPEKVYGYDT